MVVKKKKDIISKSLQTTLGEINKIFYYFCKHCVLYDPKKVKYKMKDDRLLYYSTLVRKYHEIPKTDMNSEYWIYS